MICRMRSSISSWKISRCSMVRVSASCAVIDMAVSLLQEIPQQRVPLLAQDRFRVELHALDRKRAMAHAHDLAVLRLRGHLEAIRQPRAPDRERMVARGGE